MAANPPQSGTRGFPQTWSQAAEVIRTRSVASEALIAFGLFALCHSWLVIVRDLPQSFWPLASYTLQQALIWIVFVLVDERLNRRWLRFAWAGLATLYATATVLDALLLRMVALPLRDILPMLLASEDVIAGLREIGLKPWKLSLAALLLLAAAITGGSARLLLPRLVTRLGLRASEGLRLGARGLLLVPLVLGGFALEQTLSRDRPDYLFRVFRMPVYAQLYSTSSLSKVLPLPRPISHDQRASWLAQVGPAKNPKHVLYVLLESFRADAVLPAACPNMYEIAQGSLYFERALAEAAYTPLSWSVLLFDEAAHDNLYGRYPARPQPLGSWLLAVLKRAGYTPHVFISTNLTYAHTRQRMLGPEPHALDFFQAASDESDDPAEKNHNDRVAVDKMVRFIEHHDWSGGPQFMLVQLDSTHYTYPFPESDAIFKPYSESLVLPRMIETEAEAKLLRNRYLNAVHFVDSQLGRVIAALRRAGVYDDMAIVLTSDHGEGLTPGFQGHATVYEATRHVPLMFRFPGRAPERSHDMISHRDVLPTLSEYLGIQLPAGSLRGQSASAGPAKAVLTLSPSGRFGQFITDEQIVDLRLVFEPEHVTITPSGAAAADSGNTERWFPLLAEFLTDQRARH